MLRKRILQTLEKRRDIDQRKLARIAGLSESSISRFLHGYEEANLEAVLRMVKVLYPEEEVEVMVEHIMTQKSRNARLGLEYCVMHHRWEQVDDLVELLSGSTNPLDKEWAAVYELIRMRTEKLLPSLELLRKVEMLKPKDLEMQVLKTILKGYLYFDMDEHHSLSLHIEGIESLIQEINSGFIRESFYVRLSLIMNIVHLYANNLVEARRYSYAVIGQDYFEHVKGGAYNNLGQSYMFEDYQKAENYFHKALDYLITYDQSDKVQIIQHNLSFLYSFWEVEREFTQSLDSQRTLLNYIYHLIKKRDTSLALEHLNQIKVETLPEWEKAYFNYYKGLITEDIAYFYSSVDSFLNMNDYFQLQLPLMELKNLGQNEEALRIISSRRGNMSEKAN